MLHAHITSQFSNFDISMNDILDASPELCCSLCPLYHELFVTARVPTVQQTAVSQQKRHLPFRMLPLPKQSHMYFL